MKKKTQIANASPGRVRSKSPHSIMGIGRYTAKTVQQRASHPGAVKETGFYRRNNQIESNSLIHNSATGHGTFKQQITSIPGMHHNPQSSQDRVRTHLGKRTTTSSTSKPTQHLTVPKEQSIFLLHVALPAGAADPCVRPLQYALRRSSSRSSIVGQEVFGRRFQRFLWLKSATRCRASQNFSLGNLAGTSQGCCEGEEGGEDVGTLGLLANFKRGPFSIVDGAAHLSALLASAILKF